jgi:hypothetical protein
MIQVAEWLGESSVAHWAIREDGNSIIPICSSSLLAGAAPQARAERPHNIYDGISFPGDTNGCFGPLVGVFGSSSLKDFILATAQDYCAYQLANGVP